MLLISISSYKDLHISVAWGNTCKFYIRRNSNFGNRNGSSVERPLTSLSADATDLTALITGHFLTEEPLTHLIHIQCSNGQFTWKRKEINEIKNSFWQRGSRKYLLELQQHQKWRQSCDNIKLGMLLAVKANNIPALQYKLGRVIRGIKCRNGLIRAAKLKTFPGLLQIHKLASLLVKLGNREGFCLTRSIIAAKKTTKYWLTR